MAGALAQVSVLADRATAHVTVEGPNDPFRGVDIENLLCLLREAGAGKQAAALVGLLSAEGRSGIFSEQGNHSVRFRFGREPDGNPAPPWGLG